MATVHKHDAVGNEKEIKFECCSPWSNKCGCWRVVGNASVQALPYDDPLSTHPLPNDKFQNDSVPINLLPADLN